ncbi:5422_t:CDS:2 [Ambispora gerdemannii]|uniref:5422_t:CDS:1 n=1 Tax=Ambispora gerdemannii TaxID=144530 RepID=A0A9N9FHD4_9GLOM|nr:5422_t:CDS:2 [Ambispora gerdemannii]
MSKFSTKTLNNSEETSLSEEVQHQLAQLKAENQFLKNQLEEISQGGIKILFSGKANAQRVARKVKPRTLREIKSLSIDNEEGQTKNLVIEGDNLLAMATLYQYHGKIDLIIADPPYNTGKDFRYNDKLIMMREMLKPSGVLAICIDYRELFNLGKMLDENDSKHLSNSTEYALVYAKSEERAITGKLERSEEQKNRYQNPDNDPKGKIVYPPLASGWRAGKSEFKKMLEEWGSEYEEKDLQDGCFPALSGHNQGATNELYNRVVLDPFAGSGTTGEAVLQLNKETNANRHFILIELGNPGTDDSYCRTLLQKRLAATITGK